MRYFIRHLCHFLLALFFLLIFFKPACFAQDFVRLGKVGEWNNNYGNFKAVDVKEIDGNTYAFCATSRGMAVFSIHYENVGQNRTKAEVTFVSLVSLEGCTDIVIEESGGFEKNFYAYITTGDKGLYIRNVTDPKFSYHIGSCDTPGIGEGVAVSGEYAFVADGDNGLQIIDIISEEDPVIVGVCDTPGYALGVTIYGNYAFIADGDNGLQIIDIISKEDPVIVGTYTSGYAMGVAIAGDYAFVADYWGGLQVIDISNKEKPVIVGTYAPGSATGVVIAGDYAFVADYWGGLQVIDICNKEEPVIVGTYAPGSAMGVAIAGDYAFVADYWGGLQVIDICNKEELIIVGTCDTPGSAKGVTIDPNESGDYAFVADRNSGLQIIDISDKEDPVIVGACDTPDDALEVTLSGGYAFVADRNSGLQIIDISDKEDPVIVGACDTPDDALEVALSGGYAFVADGNSGLQIIDISNKEDPVIVGTCNTPSRSFPNRSDIFSEANGVTISGEYAFVAHSSQPIEISGLQIIDISNEGKPISVGNCDILSYGYAEGVTLSGNYAFVAYSHLWVQEFKGGILIIDISNKKNPNIVGNCNTPNFTRGIAISELGDYAFVANSETGLLKFKINIGPPPPGKGNLILVAGGNINYKSLNYSSPGQQPTNILMRKRGSTLDFPENKISYSHITQALANHVFNTFQNSGYEVYDIYYFNPDPLQDTDNDGYPNQLVVDDPYPTRERLMEIIRQFPEDHLANDGPLYIYLIGHASQDSFLITSNSVITAQDLRDAIDKFQNGYTDSEGTYHPGTNRQVVLIIESSASGTFINDLAGPGITVITSTDEGASYIKPDFSDTESIPYNSFTKAFIDSLAPHLDPNNIPEGPPETLNARINNLLKEAFITARDQIRQWAVDGGQPFTDQAPQMALPETELISLKFSENGIIPLTHLSISTFQDIPYDLTIIGYDLNNTPISISEDMTFFSSDSTILDPGNTDDIQMILDPSHIPWYSIFPKKNGRITLIAYPAEETDPHHLLSAKINIDVSIDDPVYFKDTGRMAIIVAGYQGIEDYLWESTNRIANYAYKTLRNMGYTKQEIYYYNPYLMQDPVENSACHDRESCNDIDGYPIIDIFEPDTDLNSPYCAFSRISDPNIKTKELFLYLVGHGTQGAFCLNPTTLLQADYLIDRIEAIAEKVSDKIVFVYDASYSGSFLSEIEKRSTMDDNLAQKLITITSTDPNQKAYFLNQGLTSFSYPFFSKWFTTSSLMTAYDHARDSLTVKGQTPCISDPALVHLWDQEKIYYTDEGIPVIEIEEKAMALIISSDPDIFPEEDTREKLTAQLNQSHAILLNRGFSEAQIKYITSLSYLDNVSFLTEADTLFIYIIGKTQMQENGTPYFVLNTYEALTPERFSNITWNTGQRLLILMDTPYACQFLSAIDPNHLPENWAGIASTNQGELFFHIYEDPNKKSFPCFSSFFFSMIHSGTTVAQAYRSAKNMVSITQQNPALFLKTGVGSEYDINRYLNYYIGTSAIYEKGDALFTECSAKVENNNLWLSLTANPGIDENNFNTWVVLKPSPSSMTQNIMIIDLSRATNITNTVVSLDGQENPSGPLYIQEMFYNPQYLTALFIVEGRKQSDETILTEWKEVPILQSTIDIGVDTYEPDDDPNIILFDKRHEIIINAPPKRHTFYNEYTDWSYFYATEGCIYEVYAQDLSEYGYFIQLALYDPNIRPIQSDGHYLVSHNYLAFPCGRSGYYLLKVTPASGYPPEGVEYILNVLNPSCCHKVPFEMKLPAGWAMISLPVIPNSMVLSDLFPEAVVVYGYKKESGYVRIKRGEELEPGKGYWMLFNNAQNLIFTGEQIYEYPFSFSQDGWDMIGGCTYPAKASSDSCAIDVIYEYVPESGYQRLLETDHIEPGKGYWILCNDISDHCQIRIKTEDP